MDMFERFKPEIVLVGLKLGLAAMYIFAKLAMTDGTNSIVFVAYKSVIGAMVIAPASYFKQKKERAHLNFSIFCQIFGLSLLGLTLHETLFYTGMSFTGSTFATAINNLVPVTTFMISALFGLEKLNMNTTKGIAKAFGTIVCVSGAMIMTLYKEPAVKFVMSSGVSLVGSACLLASVLCTSIWLTLQTYVIKSYPDVLALTALQSCFGGLQIMVFALIKEGFSADKWFLGWNLNLLSIMYSGTMGCLAQFILCWCIGQRGSVFVATFYPLTTLFTAFFECTIFLYPLDFGSVVGATTIIVGLYSVLWGKAKENERLGSTLENVHGELIDNSSPLLISFSAS